ncbi:MAG: hypothetical protein HY901_18480 [Deltaproteobacteria bacterium]|nr:hypothetical protein [Deltaproteobacteria bacterium]
MAHAKLPTRVVCLVTRRYSVLIRRILEQYGQNATILIDNCEYQGGDVPKLLADWCTNRMIRRTLNFQVIRDGVAVFGFHDSPEDIWAAETELPFVEKLVAEKITRYEVPRAATPREEAAARKGLLGCLLVLLAAGGLVGFVFWLLLGR